MENNPEFKAIIEQGKREAKMKADESKALNRAEMAEAKAKANLSMCHAGSTKFSNISTSSLK